MSVDIHSEDGVIIRQLIPLSTLPSNQFELLCKDMVVESIKKNEFLFKRNDSTNELLYLIDGTVTLQSDTLKVESIKSGAESSRFALAHQNPRKIDAFTNTAVRFLRLNVDIISNLPSLSYEEENSYMVTDEIEEDNNSDDDWMATLLKSPIFKALPPQNLQQIIMGLEEVIVEKGEKIITQGEEGDFYYLIKKGQCLLSRKPSENAKEIKLGLLRSQDTFGEDSLLSGLPRNVSITAVTKTKLLRLSKDKFISLIKKPALKFISHTDVNNEIAKGSLLLDVRPPDEYKVNHLPNSINMPFFSLRMQLKTFDKKKGIVVVCADGKASEAAAFLLLRHKIDALNVDGGMEKAPPQQAEKPMTAAAFAIDDGIETLTDGTNTHQSNEESIDDLTGEDLIAQGDVSNTGSQDNLQLENQKLKQMVAKLTADKEMLEKKYRILYKQSEKLKAVLDTMKIGGGSN